ncbi:unnamed protein product [Symbiodinium sp. CCMP2592]|nr:unnamed protein product [Symbiodinium sp. CCMP2592]
MATSSGWRCGRCKLTCKASASFCPNCGGAWQQVAEGQPPYAWESQSGAPWREEPAGWSGWGSYQKRAQSPRSPRKRGKGRGQPANASQKGTGQGIVQPSQAAEGATSSVPTPPSTDSLPAPPTAPAATHPRKPTADVEHTQEKQQLNSLLAMLATSSVELPEAAQQMVATYQQANSQTTARTLHRAVTEQTKAKQALHKVQANRIAYMTAWKDYITQVTTMLDTQIREQAQVLAQFDESELQWAQAELAASQTLAKLAVEKETVEVPDNSSEEMETAETTVQNAIEEEARLRATSEQQQQASRELMEALGKVRHQAEEQLQAHQGRESSRSPRRREGAGDGNKGKPAGQSEQAVGQPAFQLGLSPSDPGKAHA